MNFLEDFLLAPLIVFLVIVAPIWIIMHYSTKKKKQAGLTESESAQLERLTEIAEKMTERVGALESILDAETPEWRKKYE